MSALVSNNYAVDFIRVDSQGTGYQVGDEVVYYPAYSGGKNGKADSRDFDRHLLHDSQ